MIGKPARPRQFGLRRIMAAIALAAVFLAVPRIVGRAGSAFATAEHRIALAAIALIMVGLALVFGVLELALGVQCPGCRAWGMQLMAARPFRPRYYRCPACGARYKRSRAGGAWRDASSEAEASWYVTRLPAHPWRFDPDVPPGDATLSGTTGDLLKNKRKRRRPKP